MTRMPAYGHEGNCTSRYHFSFKFSDFLFASSAPAADFHGHLLLPLPGQKQTIHRILAHLRISALADKLQVLNLDDEDLRI